MKNITVSVDDDIYRRARIKAAENDTSVSALVREVLVEVAGRESDIERLKRQEREIRERIRTFRARDRLSRDDVHRREEGPRRDFLTPTCFSIRQAQTLTR